MKIEINYLAGLLCIVFLQTCGMTSKLSDRSGYKKLFKGLYENNGNAFYVNSSTALSSFVWSYADRNVFIYKLSNNKVVDKQEVSRVKPNWLNEPPNEELFEIDPCMELGGWVD